MRMIRHATAALLATLAVTPTCAAAAERQWGIASFDRLRVDGPFDVRVVDGPPRARASGAPRTVERLSVELNGTTLVVRLATGGAAGATMSGSGGPIVISLSTPRLGTVMLTAPGRVRVARLSGERVTLGVTGTGSVAADRIEAQSLAATVVGAGTITLAGRAASARLTTNGPGLLDAAALATDQVTILLDGAGETRAAARYAAQVTSTGMGTVVVSGNPKCTVRAPAGGSVQCGTAAP